MIKIDYSSSYVDCMKSVMSEPSPDLKLYGNFGGNSVHKLTGFVGASMSVPISKSTDFSINATKFGNITGSGHGTSFGVGLKFKF